MSDGFFIKKAATGGGEPAQWPVEARPLVEAPPVVIYPAQRGPNGAGLPGAQYGLPYSLPGRNMISAAGLAYWNGLYETASSGSALVKVQLYDPYTATWAVYQGVLWRYTVDTAARSNYRFQNFRAKISELTPTSW